MLLVLTAHSHLTYIVSISVSETLSSCFTISRKYGTKNMTILYCVHVYMLMLVLWASVTLVSAYIVVKTRVLNSHMVWYTTN